jgi:quercetin dioxygenase-like cupin family protein
MATSKRTNKALPKGYSELMKNKNVRVLELNLKPGQNMPMHTHPNDHLVYAMTDTKLRLTNDKGKTSTVNLKKGSIVWLKAESHSVVNIGKTTSHNLVVEVKK